MATLIRRSVYKGGGVSYGVEGVRGMVYFSPSMFTGEKVAVGDRETNAPERIEIEVPNLATPDAKSSEKAAAREAARAERQAEKERRQAAKTEAREAREQERLQKKQAREEAKMRARQERDERRQSAKQEQGIPA